MGGRGDGAGRAWAAAVLAASNQANGTRDFIVSGSDQGREGGPTASAATTRSSSGTPRFSIEKRIF
jgi:hypothetical protein